MGDKFGRDDDEICVEITRKLMSNRISKVLIEHTNITANQASALSLVFLLLGGLFLALGEYKWLVIGSLFVFLYVLFDQIDGNIARVKIQFSKLGQWFDSMIGFISAPLLAFAVALGINTNTSLILGAIAMLAFPMQYTIMLYFKLDIMGVNKTIETGSRIGDILKRLYGIGLFYVVLIVFSLINMPIIVLWLFAIGGNAVWMGIIYLEYLKVRDM